MKDYQFYYSAKEFHCDIPWKLAIRPMSKAPYVYLVCSKFTKSDSYSIDARVEMRYFKNGEADCIKSATFTNVHNLMLFNNFSSGIPNDYIVDGNLSVEVTVKIDKTVGITGKLRSFDDEATKKYSDVVLIVKNEKFFVNKKYLASQSSYFESLFFGNFDESKKSEIELKDIDPYIFHEFLEVLYAKPAVDEDTIADILKLVDMYDAASVVERCEEFYIYRSKQSLEVKFHAAVKYNMVKLKEKCMAEIKTVEDFKSIIPEDSKQFDTDLWKELCQKSLTLSK
ncbi:hypothetical protein CRE_14673 [Caenorhabditis remanei]|uniref:BTB domain-containing protein n=1 Tax=Caenorhabditis remanei TaxID=31234 RepID=E3M9G7_CAERE|nr:hypothetical protein CRE_14673 [Caenorhabditis remanei]